MKLFNKLQATSLLLAIALLYIPLWMEHEVAMGVAAIIIGINAVIEYIL